MTYKALLLDADGVTILAPQPYSYSYAESRGLDPTKLEPFFTGPFREALRGKADLKELITAHHDIWQYNGDLQQLLNDWFAAENVVSVSLPPLIAHCQAKGVPVYLATNQEAYRAKYLREVMFPQVFDDILVSCEIGYLKREPEYWQAALATIAKKVPGIAPADILYLDDSPAEVAAAQAAGIDARIFTGPHQVTELMQLEP